MLSRGGRSQPSEAPSVSVATTVAHLDTHAAALLSHAQCNITLLSEGRACCASPSGENGSEVFILLRVRLGAEVSRIWALVARVAGAGSPVGWERELLAEEALQLAYVRFPSRGPPRHLLWSSPVKHERF
jgi:hypothetical protein